MSSEPRKAARSQNHRALHPETEEPYLRGSPDFDRNATVDEKPRHRVKITKDFYFGMHEVTQHEWRAVMGTEPWSGERNVKEGKDYPATYISWNDAQQFAKKLTAADGRQYRLPTEAEWEYAARGGQSTHYSFGDDDTQLGEYEWFDKNAEDVGEAYPHPVGLKKPNSFGLFDMHGNVYEWCHDYYESKEYSRYSEGTINDPQGPQYTFIGGPGIRVLRGGCWGSIASSCRAAVRGWQVPDDRRAALGFRVTAVSSLPKSR
ncbi:MAG: formylglycine-generating enzyme family protein [Planctomycetaceae bacterium]|nr:formylglycine-generating enzyme family protein [Planctomycetaceae bacterium]